MILAYKKIWGGKVERLGENQFNVLVTVYYQDVNDIP